MIQFDSVGYQYAAGQPWAVHDISCQIEAGSFHFLSGPSGAGKTTLFRLLYMDIMPTTGRYMLLGKNVNGLSRDDTALLRRQMGIVFQDARLLPELTVRENVQLALALHGKPTPAQEKSIDEIIDWVGLSAKRHVSPSVLSGGEKQRVGIARAVVNRPKLLIADEPTGNVDAAMAKRIMHLFCELHKHGTTVILATHDVGIIKQFDYPVLYLEDGTMRSILREAA